MKNMLKIAFTTLLIVCVSLNTVLAFPDEPLGQEVANPESVLETTPSRRDIQCFMLFKATNLWKDELITTKSSGKSVSYSYVSNKYVGLENCTTFTNSAKVGLCKWSSTTQEFVSVGDVSVAKDKSGSAGSFLVPKSTSTETLYGFIKAVGGTVDVSVELWCTNM